MEKEPSTSPNPEEKKEYSVLAEEEIIDFLDTRIKKSKLEDVQLNEIFEIVEQLSHCDKEIIYTFHNAFDHQLSSQYHIRELEGYVSNVENRLNQDKADNNAQEQLNVGKLLLSFFKKIDQYNQEGKIEVNAAIVTRHLERALERMFSRKRKEQKEK